MHESKKSIIKNVLAILFGFFVAFAVLGVFMVAAAFVDLSGSFLLDLIILGVPCFAGGLATASSAANYKILYAGILSIPIILLLTSWFNFNLTDNNYPKNYTEIFSIVIFSLIGGIVGSKKKSL